MSALDGNAILDLPMDENDAGATTIRDYLARLAAGIWAECEGFDSKRPFGNSGWTGDFDVTLIRAGVVPGHVDTEGEVSSIDEDAVTDAINSALDALTRPAPVTENTSDGFHTFKELYEYRLLYNAGLFNEWAQIDAFTLREATSIFVDVHKARRHSDGEPCFGGGWFVVVAQLPTGQISNHYPESAWDLFRIPEKDRAAEWDGHTPADVAERLRAFLTARDGQ